jgi:hypothetical protein
MKGDGELVRVVADDVSLFVVDLEKGISGHVIDLLAVFLPRRRGLAEPTPNPFEP